MNRICIQPVRRSRSHPSLSFRSMNRRHFYPWLHYWRLHPHHTHPWWLLPTLQTAIWNFTTQCSHGQTAASQCLLQPTVWHQHSNFFGSVASWSNFGWEHYMLVIYVGAFQHKRLHFYFLGRLSYQLKSGPRAPSFPLLLTIHSLFSAGTKVSNSRQALVAEPLYWRVEGWRVGDGPANSA